MGTKIGLAGDWHCNNTWARHAIYTFSQAGITDVFQLGDFGVAFPKYGDRMLSDVHGACTRFDVNLYIVPGNHENWAWIDKLDFDPDAKVARLTDRVTVLDRGFRGELPHGRTVGALGGAPSIDFPNRIENVTWWPTEMITLRQAEDFAAAGEVDIMLAHDAPDGGTDAVQRIIDTPPDQSMWTDRGLAYAREGRELMNIAVAGAKPKVFAHGHFHVFDEKQTEDTKFLSLDQNNTHRNLISLDLETLDHEWLDIKMSIPAS